MTDIDPRCLTSTVLDLTAGIVRDSAFDRLPILADALMDAGCCDTDLLSYLGQQDASWLEYLDWFTTRWMRAHDVAAPPDAQNVLCWMARSAQPKLVAAVADVWRIVDDLGGSSGYDEDEQTPMSFSLLMNAADEWDTTSRISIRGWGDHFVQRGSEKWRLEFHRYADEFWEAWATLTGQEPNSPSPFFSCSC